MKQAPPVRIERTTCGLGILEGSSDPSGAEAYSDNDGQDRKDSATTPPQRRRYRNQHSDGPPPLVRFMAKTRRDDKTGCLVWTAFRSPRGYGRFQIAGGLGGQAHRWIYEQTVGPIPPGMVIDHLCRNRACVEVAHMEVVTPGENTLRGEGPTARNRRKDRCLNGHPLAGENLGRLSTGGRRCLTCNRASAVRSKFRAAIREIVAAYFADQVTSSATHGVPTDLPTAEVAP